MAKLTSNDIELIFKQCELQGATKPEQIKGFALAYLHAKGIVENGTAHYIDKVIHYLAYLIEPKYTGYRNIPVIFANGNSAANHKELDRLMGAYCNAFRNSDFVTAREAYIEFEKIHPFVDGNGRLGHLLWAIYEVQIGGEWPDTLPPKVF